MFEKLPEKGLSNLLIGEGTLGELVAPSGTKGVDVLGSGPIPPNPVELLAGERCANLLTEAAHAYDHVIIDTSPVLIASDAVVLASMVDGVILVVRASQSSRGMARRACALLSDVSRISLRLRDGTNR